VSREIRGKSASHEHPTSKLVAIQGARQEVIGAGL
jgi:hypothetical protein